MVPGTATTTSSETTFENKSTTNKHFIIFPSDSDSAHFIPYFPLSVKIHLSLLKSCVIFALFHPSLLPTPHGGTPQLGDQSAMKHFYKSRKKATSTSSMRKTHQHTTML